jgi:Lrp/AsnC family transcriptional regulator, leucine-responsive regulatory protein
VDEDDVRICMALMVDSRTSYDRLSKTLGMSVPAVHKRLKGLVETGVVQAFTASIDVASLGGVSALVYGHSPIASLDEVIDRVHADDSTWLVLMSGGGMVHCFAFLRNERDLACYIENVRVSLRMDDAAGHLHGLRPGDNRMGPRSATAPTPLELRIINAMREDSRRRASEVAADLGVSARTVNSKQVSMRREGKAIFSIRWCPDYSREAVALIHLKLVPGTTIQEVIPRLFNRFKNEIVILSAFRDRSDLLVCTIWADHMRGIGRTAKDMADEIGAGSYTTHPIFQAQHLECWKDRYPVEHNIQ